MNDKHDADDGSAQIRALLGLRQLILDGELKPGDRLSELALVSRLGVSRTPVRMALVRLHEEGFVDALATGGFVVRSFSERDALDAIELRGTLEGMAARQSAERGPPASILRRMRKCLGEIDAFLEIGDVRVDVSPYLRLNDEFHGLLWDAAQSDMLRSMIDRLVRLPFAAPNAFTLSRLQQPALKSLLTYAQIQHWDILEAIELREGARAEALAREHSRAASKYLREVLDAKDHNAAAAAPSLRMIRRLGT